MSTRQIPGIAALALALAAAGCSPDALPASAGVVFEREVVDLGRLHAGETVTVRFGFRVGGQEVRVDRMQTSCGCLNPRIVLDDGTTFTAGALSPGAAGEVVVDYATLGFRGPKITGVTLRGSGPGLPAQLRIESVLEERFRIEPHPVDFGAVRGDEALAIDVTVRADEPFRVTELLAGAAPLRVGNLPSPEPGRAQRIRVVLPPTREEGRHAAFLNLATDLGLPFRVPVRWEVVGEIYTLPGPKLLLGKVRADEATFAAIRMGARVGTLAPPEVELIDLPGAEARVETVVEGSEYRVSLKLPEGLPTGSLAGEVVLRSERRVRGSTEPVERRVQVFGVVG